MISFLKKYSIFLGLVFSLCLPFLGESAETKNMSLAGDIGASAKWGSGWIDLAPAVDFLQGDRLRIKVGRTAGKILVRLLAKGQYPDSSDGIIGGTTVVPKSRIVEVRLDSPKKGIIQISIHGGPNPWGKFPLGGANGPATLETVDLIRN